MKSISNIIVSAGVCFLMAPISWAQVVAPTEPAPSAPASAATATEAPTPPGSEGTPGPPPAQPVQPQAQPEKSDPGARLFMQKCAGCHTVGGGALTGPDLKAVQTWPRQNVDPAILRMEKNVGKLKPEDVQTLAELLLAPDASGRIADERKRIAMQEMAKLEPANAATGEDLYFGRKPLANRGLACVACHALNGNGGNLAADLAGSFAKLGEVPLASTIEGVTFPLMKAAYSDNAITKQETVHIVKFLESAGARAGNARKTPPLHAIGSVGAILALLGLSRHFRKRNRGVRASLVADAMRRSRS